MINSIYIVIIIGISHIIVIVIIVVIRCIIVIIGCQDDLTLSQVRVIMRILNIA